MEQQQTGRARPVGLHAAIGIMTLVAIIGLLLVAFYEPFPTITVLNAADQPIKNVSLQTDDFETQIETHSLGTLQVGQSREVTVRAYQARVVALSFEMNGEIVQHRSDPLPITQGQVWRLTVGRGGKVTGAYAH